jgi:hypothetical protein
MLLNGGGTSVKKNPYAYGTSGPVNVKTPSHQPDIFYSTVSNQAPSVQRERMKAPFEGGYAS